MKCHVCTRGYSSFWKIRKWSCHTQTQIQYHTLAQTETYIQTDRQTLDRQTDTRIQSGTQTFIPFTFSLNLYRRTDRDSDSQADTQADTQTDRETHRQTATDTQSDRWYETNPEAVVQDPLELVLYLRANVIVDWSTLVSVHLRVTVDAVSKTA